jgi:transcriptional regulator with XRE-family HTH domain
MFQIETYLEMDLANHKLKEWRKFRGLTMQAFAERMGVSLAVVSRVERGQQPYRQDYLERAAEVLQCDVADLIVRDPTIDPTDIAAIYRQLDPETRAVAAAMLEALLRGKK